MTATLVKGDHSMLHEKTIEYITGLSDERLVEYLLLGTRIYEPEALAFAQKELDRRQIAPERLSAIRQPMISEVAKYDAKASIDVATHRQSAILCQGCGFEVPNAYVEYRQNIGAIVVRFSQRYRGCLCKRCGWKYFKMASVITLFGGWWGFISFFITPLFLFGNFVDLLKTSSLPTVAGRAGRPRYDDEVATQLLQHVEFINEQLEAGENIEEVARQDAGVTPGQALLFIHAVLRQPVQIGIQAEPLMLHRL